MVPDALIDSYTADGAVCVPAALDQRWVELLRDGVAANMASPSEYSCEYTPDGAPGRFWDDYCSWQRIPQYRTVLFESPLAELAATLMASSSSFRS